VIDNDLGIDYNTQINNRVDNMSKEDQIEQAVERETNKLDQQLMRGRISQREYDRKITELDNWAERYCRSW